MADDKAQREAIIMKFLNDPKYTGGRDRLYGHIRLQHPNISRRDIAAVLADDPIHQMHQPLKKRVTTRPITISDRAKVAQIDLIDFKGLTGYNDGHRYALTYVDLLSKYCAARAVTKKTQQNVMKALQDILNSIPKDWRPKTIQADNGGEFATQLAAMLRDQQIKTIHSQAYNPRSQGAIERFNKTLKSAIFSQMARHKTSRWIDMLEPLCDNFNNTKHESTGYKPIDLMTRPTLTKQLIEEIHARMERRRPKHPEALHHVYAIGDLVRVALTTESAIRKQTFRKKIKNNWSEIVYQIYSISAPEAAGAQPQYLLTNLTTHRKSKKKYWGYQMQQVSELPAPVPAEPETEQEEEEPPLPIAIAPPEPRAKRAWKPSAQALLNIANR